MEPVPTLDTPAEEPVYPIDAALQAALRDAKATAARTGNQAATSAALLDIAIRRHPLFGALIGMLRTGHVRIEEPRRMSVTDKAALLAPPRTEDEGAKDEDTRPPGLVRSIEHAREIVDDLDVPKDDQPEAIRRALLLARECLPREPRQRGRVKT